MKKILVAISDSFPYGAAYAARTRALCKLFQAAGYETDILCDYISGNSDTKEYGEIYFVSEGPYYGLKKLLKLPNDYKKKLESLLVKNKYDYVVARSMFDRFDKVFSVVRKYSVPLILESCEWYDVRGFKHGRLDIRYYQFLHCFQRTYNKVDGVIAISRLLEQHYKQFVKNVIRVPGIHEVEKLPYRTEVTEKGSLNLIFGGNAIGGKEEFSSLLIALYQIKASERNICLHIYGSSEQEVVNSLEKEAKQIYIKLKEVVIFHGHVPQEEMANVCMESDFGVFFRPDRRSSHAGFPTKLGEYLAAGTPVITNDTGDISFVLENGQNGYLLSNSKPETICKVIETCMSLDTEQYQIMRKAARESALRKLDYTIYAEIIKSFLEGVV